MTEKLRMAIDLIEADTDDALAIVQEAWNIDDQATMRLWVAYVERTRDRALRFLAELERLRPANTAN